MGQGAIIVIDLGKTLSKVTLWTSCGRLLDRQVRPNAPVVVDGLNRLDVDGIGDWLLQAMAAYRDHPIETIIPVGHGAGVVALAGDRVAFPPLDYEQALPAEVIAAYRAQRDPFAITGSPALPDGLNFGSQLFWLEQLCPQAMATATLLPWAQFWAWFLTGRAVSEVTSLGCHSDVWRPREGRFSPMAQRRGWADRFAPMVRAGDVVGTLTPQLAARTGLPDTVQVLAGLHDSNAALLAARGFDEIALKEATILSTGTWFIAMRLPGEVVFTSTLSETRDCLVNIDAYGKPVPSARFMGGREIEQVIGIDTRRVDIRPDQPALLAAIPAVLQAGAMMLPTLVPGCGPFPDHVGQWVNEPDDWYQRRAAICLYAALVTDAALDLIGARDRLLIEGRFAEAEVFVRALAALRPETTVMVGSAHNDVSFGALRLLNPLLKPAGELRAMTRLEGDLAVYRDRWRAAVAATA